jgi:hypothetical protein
MTRKEAIAAFFEKYRLALIEDQKGKNIRASGLSATTLRAESSDIMGRLFGKDYIHFQKVGRKPGGFPPIESIIQWIKDKKIPFEGIKIESLAFLIARKIAKSGTDIYIGKRPALSIEEKVGEFKAELIRDILKIGKAEIVSALTKLKVTA